MDGKEELGDILVEAILKMTAVEISETIIAKVEVGSRQSDIMMSRRKDLYLMIIDRLQKEIDRVDGGVVVSE